MTYPFSGTQGFHDYLNRVEPKTMLEDLPNWPADPTDILAFADIAMVNGKQYHALAFYDYALTLLEKDPSKISGDTNLSGAYYSYGKMFIELKRAPESIDPLTKAVALDRNDASSWYLLGTAYMLTNDYKKALGCLGQTLKLEDIDQRQGPDFFADIRSKAKLLKKMLEM